jgi:methylase of polypeptide subunit release factors
MACSCCDVTDRWFDEKMASADLRRFQRKGPNPTTRLLLSAIRDHAPQVATLLDIGSGVGAIAHELLHDGVSHATVVDMSQAYLSAAKSESTRRGTFDRIHAFGSRAGTW